MAHVHGNLKIGHAPRKQVLIDFNTALLNGDTKSLMEYISDNIIWEIVGSKKGTTKKDFAKEVQHLSNERQITELRIEQIITHGRSASLNGEWVDQNGLTIGFCSVYMFSSTAKDAKIKELKTYRVLIN